MVLLGCPRHATQRKLSPLPLPVEYRKTKRLVVPRRTRASTFTDHPVHVSVEYYRASYNEVRQLEKYLRDYEAVQDVSTPKRKGSGAVELGHVLYVHLLPVIVSYAGNKMLKIVEDRVKQWFKEHGKKEQFITLGLSGQRRQHKIGRGRPKRYF